MDRKQWTTSPKFNPAYHPPPSMNPTGGTGSLSSLHQPAGGPHPHAAPAHQPAHAAATNPSGGLASAFGTVFQLPMLGLNEEPPLAPSAAGASTPGAALSALKARRERLMRRHNTASASFESTVAASVDSTTPPPSPTHLLPPTVVGTKMTLLEPPPHRRDTLEKIPRRARSQSWLVRTRHVFDDEKLMNRTPWIAHCLYACSVLLLILTFPFCLPFCVKIAKEYERAVVFRTGRLIRRGTKGPGLFFVIPCIDTYRMVDLRMLSFDVPPQEILSRDSVTVSVEAVIYFRVSNPVISVTNVNDAQFSTKLLAQTTLRNVCGTKTLQEILQERDSISGVTEKVLEEGTEPWGVKVQRVEIKDIRLPQMLTRAMAAEAEASRDARARIIAADGERNASRNLVEAANVICTSRAALHLRYLQTLNRIAADRNETIVIPVPMEVVRAVMRKLGTLHLYAKP